MVNIDMWYGDKKESVDRLDCSFYPNECEYRGNLYINNKYVGDYTCRDSCELEKAFPQLKFNWN